MIKKRRIGKNQEKNLLLLMAGIALSFTKSPKQYYRIINSTKRSWREIDKKIIESSFQKLANSKLISFQETKNGKFKAILTKNGIQKATSLNFKNIEIKKPKKWDKLWRVVVFDIPEKNRMSRDSLRMLLKKLNFIELQKSVFVLPYECEKEIYRVVNFFDIHKYVNFFRVQYINDEQSIKEKFKL